MAVTAQQLAYGNQEIPERRAASGGVRAKAKDVTIRDARGLNLPAWRG